MLCFCLCDEIANIWQPHTSSIVDLVRCSVVFDTVENLISGLNEFMNFIDDGATIVDKNNNNQEREICIKQIVRVKNGFSSIPNQVMQAKLNVYDYRDIKLNVIIEHKGIRLIGEIQLLLKFMLIAKKKGHSIYGMSGCFFCVCGMLIVMGDDWICSERCLLCLLYIIYRLFIGFVRKEDFFYQLNTLVTDENEETKLKQIQKMIVSNNMSQFSSFLQNCNKFEKQCVVNNKSKIRDYIAQGKWKKGQRLFDLVLQAWN